MLKQVGTTSQEARNMEGVLVLHFNCATTFTSHGLCCSLVQFVFLCKGFYPYFINYKELYWWNQTTQCLPHIQYSAHKLIFIIKKKRWGSILYASEQKSNNTVIRTGAGWSRKWAQTKPLYGLPYQNFAASQIWYRLVQHTNEESHFLTPPVGTGVLLKPHSQFTHLYVLKAGWDVLHAKPQSLL